MLKTSAHTTTIENIYYLFIYMNAFVVESAYLSNQTFVDIRARQICALDACTFAYLCVCHSSFRLNLFKQEI